MCMTIMCTSSMRPMCGLEAWNIELGHGAEFAAVAAGERDGTAADRVGVFDRAQDIGGIAGAADGHHHVAGLGEILQLLDEDAVVADVIGVGRNGGQGVGERHDAEALIAVEAGALDHVADEVRGGGCAAAVAAHKNAAVLVARPLEDVDGLADLLQVDGIDGLQNVGFIE